MKILRRSNFYIFLVAGLILASLGLQLGVHAASSSLYISPSSVSVQNGKSFSVSIVVSPGGAKVDTVDVSASFPSSLKYTGHSVKSPFGEFSGTYSSGSGKVKFVATINGGSYVTKATTVATLSFTAESSSGSATISLSGSGAAYSGSAINPGLGGATVKFSAPPKTAPAPKSTPTQTTQSDQTSTSQTTTSKDTADSKTTTTDAVPVSSTVDNVSPSFTKVELSVESSAPTSVYVKYSSDGENYQTTKASKFATSHQTTLDGLSPGGTYYYQVISKDKAGHTTKSSVSTIQTRGLTVTVEVQDKNYQPLSNKKVSLHSTPQTVQTNSEGLATFTNVAPGDHTVSYVDGGQTYSEGLAITSNVELTEAGTESAAVQKLFVVLPFSQSGSRALLWPIVVVVALLIVVAIVIIVRARRKKLHDVGAAQNPPAVVSPITSLSSNMNSAAASSISIKPAEPEMVKPLVDQMSAQPAPQPGSTIAPSAGPPQYINSSPAIRPDVGRDLTPPGGPENGQGR